MGNHLVSRFHGSGARAEVVGGSAPRPCVHQPDAVLRRGAGDGGHRSPLITLRIYRQVFEDEFEEAREMLSGRV